MLRSELPEKNAPKTMLKKWDDRGTSVPTAALLSTLQRKPPG